MKHESHKDKERRKSAEFFQRGERLDALLAGIKVSPTPPNSPRDEEHKSHHNHPGKSQK